ncbi:hypothetical protein AGRA3207_007469 [Actinomadura graeca]|uniref:Uncharacterized protein n=1 Tax=Actinomadura graeca TaxID=2750812 RepID=A0ABX8R488_9ACTN|nr:DUF6245 family protein [Actinomadura graeca]QXJ25900.1 hypothetical protein AGRA3207_007469 [Actinomadura graeca]
MSAASSSSQAPPVVSAASVSAALAALGAYAKPPTDAELAAQADAVGGEHVLAAMLANALYGAAIGAGMMAEGRMIEIEGNDRALPLGRQQVLKASGATGPGVTGMLHWQASQVGGPLRGWSRRADLGPLGGAAADVAWALTLLLQALTVTEPTDPRFDDLHKNVSEARALLAAAAGRLDELTGTAAEMAAALVRLWDHVDA